MWHDCHEIPTMGCNLIMALPFTHPKQSYTTTTEVSIGLGQFNGNRVSAWRDFNRVAVWSDLYHRTWWKPTLDSGTGQLAASDRRLSRLSPGDCCRTGGESVTMADDCGDPGRPLTSGVSRSLIATALLPLSRGYSHRCPPAPCLCVGLFRES